MRAVKCPEEYVKESKDYVIFLAGGITGCKDWQQEATRMFDGANYGYGFKDLVIINPRRDDFDTSDPRNSIKQIEWEHKYLMMADEVLFWFPKEGMCMITLFELGKMLGSKKRISIGCHPDYIRALDVHHQIRLINPVLANEIHPSLESLIISMKHITD